MFGRLACIESSNICGFGGAEHNWKEVTRVKTPTRNQLGSDKIAKLTTLVGCNCATKPEWYREAQIENG